MVKSGNRFHHFFSRGYAGGLAAAVALAVPGVLEGVSPERLARLSKGINSSHWFAQVFAPEGYAPQHFRNYFSEKDVAFVASAGLRHIRLSVEPEGLFSPEEPSRLGKERLRELDRAIGMILSYRLGVIVDIHTYGPFLDKLTDDDRHLAAVAEFWQALAAHLAERYDPDWLYLELLNEPQIRSAERWQKIAATLAAAARRGAPEHTLIVTGKEWSNIDDLLVFKPLADRNVVYNFHFYEPGVFSHQGATWSYPPWAQVRQVPYPVTPEILKKSAASALNEEGRRALDAYAGERWNRFRIEARIRKIADWAKKYDVPLSCNEFGVYIKYAPAADRLEYLRDVRSALEKFGIGWTMWDYAENFRLVAPRGGSGVRLDDGMAGALGLE